jgi:hypothetical protein
MSSKDPKAVFFAHSARASAGVRFRKTCSFERCGREELGRYFDRQKPHERTHLTRQHVFKGPKSSIFRTLSSCLRWRPIQEDVFFRALRTGGAGSLLRSSKAAREDTPNLPACLQRTQKQYFSHTQLVPPLAFDSGRRVLSSAADGRSWVRLPRRSRSTHCCSIAESPLLENVFRKCHLFEKFRKVTVPKVNNIKSFHPKR